MVADRSGVITLDGERFLIEKKRVWSVELEMGGKKVSPVRSWLLHIVVHGLVALRRQLIPE
jgi:hypothetical protein